MAHWGGEIQRDWHDPLSKTTSHQNIRTGARASMVGKEQHVLSPCAKTAARSTEHAFLQQFVAAKRDGLDWPAKHLFALA